MRRPEKWIDGLEQEQVDALLRATGRADGPPSHAQIQVSCRLYEAQPVLSVVEKPVVGAVPTVDVSELRAGAPPRVEP